MSTEKPLFRAIFAALFLSTGAVLLTYIFFQISLGIALIFVFVMIGCLLSSRLYVMEAPQRKAFLRQLGKGVIIGLLATAAYDISRLALVTLLGWHLNPFKAFPYFGQAIAGEGISANIAIIIGAIYHVINGVFFAISYCLLLSGRRWFYGIFWALGLEILMFTIYPTWLDLSAVMKEFTIVSVSGHLAYGAVLGILAKKNR